MCGTNDQELADMMGILRVHGSKPKYYHKYIGFNSRLDSLQAAVLSVKLRYLDEWHEGRRRNAADYSAKLAGVDGLDLPQVAEYGRGDGKEPYHIYNQYTIRVTNGRRDAVVAGMKERGDRLRGLLPGLPARAGVLRIPRLQPRRPAEQRGRGA